MTAFIEMLVVSLIIGAALAWLTRKTFGKNRKSCGCTSCPSKTKKPLATSNS